MLSCFRSLIVSTSIVAAPALEAHESFLPLHDFHLHQTHGHASHGHADGKTAAAHEHAPTSRFHLASGTRYTRLSLDGEAAHLWETTVGVEYTATPWLHVGVDATYGWFDSDEGRADGLMVPHAHVDLHLPLGGAWEVLAGFDVGFPGGEETLVGDHWEFAPSVELRFDRHTWFAGAGASFVFTEGDDHHDHVEAEPDDEEEHARDCHAEDEDHDEHETHAGHSDAAHDADDFHEIVDPHGKRELRYHAAFGVRVLDERLELESRLSGIHVTSGDTPDRNYLRAGLRASWKCDERCTISAQASAPLTDARRNEWQASLAVRVGF